ERRYARRLQRRRPVEFADHEVRLINLRRRAESPRLETDSGLGVLEHHRAAEHAKPEGIATNLKAFAIRTPTAGVGPVDGRLDALANLSCGVVPSAAIERDGRNDPEQEPKEAPAVVDRFIIA